MVSIDPRGFFESVTLSGDRHVLLKGIPPGETVLSYAFRQTEAIGLAEMRLFSSPMELDFFLFPRAPMHRALRPVLIEEDALQHLRRQSIWYGNVETIESLQKRTTKGNYEN